MDLKVYNDIVDESQKLYLETIGGIKSVCFKDIDEAVNAMSEDDTNIDLHIHCAGGNCIEGWAMYDKLRNSGKTISATIDGNCSSMATILLLSAPKDRRFATQNARICIHNPYIAYMDLWANENLTADKLDALASKVHSQANMLRDEQNRILNLYVERTGSGAEELQSLMNEDKYIDMKKAVELGFVSSVLAPNTDKKSLFNQKVMEKEIKVNESLWNKVLAKLGFNIVARKLTTADGSELDVDTENEPKVGDSAKPDGAFVMPDGTTIVVEGGVITAITPKAEETEEITEEEAKKEDETKAEEVETETETKEEEATEEDVETLKAKIAELEAENEELKKKLAESEPTEEAKETLDIVAKAGGSDWLKKIVSVESKARVASNQFSEENAKPEVFDCKSIIASELESARAFKDKFLYK